jgi:AraC-like DNA-binding protein
VRGYLTRYPSGGHIDEHDHDWDQITVITHSAVTIETEKAFFVQPPGRAFWLPAGTRHAIHANRMFSLYCLYSESGHIALGSTPTIVALSDLAQELIFLVCSAPAASARTARIDHAIALLTLILADAREEPFRLPRPSDARAGRLATYFLDHPEDSRALDTIIAEVGGASLRTLERIFLAETGLTVAAWRRQSRLLMSLYLLDEGGPIATIASKVGYDSPAAFSTAFKACFGAAPSAYLGAKRGRG